MSEFPQLGQMAVIVTLALLAPMAHADMEQDSLDRGLRSAAFDGRLNDVVNLIARGAKVAQNRDNYGKTPLLLAAISGQYKVIDYLLQKGANPDEADDHDNTPLLLAAMSCSTRSSELLLKYGANVNRRNYVRQTPLINAAEQACGPVVKMLLLAPGIDIRALNDWGKSAWDYAKENFELGHDMRSALLLDELKARKLLKREIRP